MKSKFTNQLRDRSGFGSQYQTLIYAILMAEVYYNGEYIYTTPTLEEIYDKEESLFLEDVMNIKNNYRCKELIDDENIQDIDFSSSRDFVENNLDMILNSESMLKIKNIFFKNKDLNIFDKDFFNVTIHIRRPSIHKNIDLPSHFSDIVEYNPEDKNKINYIHNTRISHDNYFLKIINSIRNDYKDKKIKFHICSEGDLSQFENFISDDTVFHLNKPLDFTYLLMTLADIFVMSKSSFSYPAALLSDGIIYYPSTFWHKPSSKWKIVY